MRAGFDPKQQSDAGFGLLSVTIFYTLPVICVGQWDNRLIWKKKKILAQRLLGRTPHSRKKHYEGGKGMKNLASALIALVLAWGNAANAAVIYDNGASVDSLEPSDSSASRFSADDFSLAPGANVITGIQWTGAYLFSNVPTVDNFTIHLYADIGGSPATVPFFFSTIGAPGRTDTGMDVAGFDLYAYSVDVAPIPLAPNTPFWLSIFNDTAADPNNDWFWGLEFSAGNSRFGSGAAWNLGFHRLDFTLTGPVGVPEAVPEPATLALVGLGLLFLLGYYRKEAR